MQAPTSWAPSFLRVLQNALTDSDAGVREAAGAAFSIMFKGGAGGAVDSVVPQLLEGAWQAVNVYGRVRMQV